MGGLSPRGGERRLSREANVAGSLGAVDPSDFEEHEAPEYICVAIRLSWGPAHLNVAFEFGRTRGKISFRPESHHSAAWNPAVYSDTTFVEDTREALP